MRTQYLLAGLLACGGFLTAPAMAQNPPARQPSTAQSIPAPAYKHSGEWRASKLIGVDVYNNANEKIGDINEILLAPNGDVAGVIIGVGGFLGMGEHDVLVKLDQIKFVTEPVRTTTTTSSQRPATTTGTSVTTRPVRATNEKWYPDHAVMNATKEQLKAMPQFKYN
jgi:sporulation protein YlmC with PRC-barrel domain